MFKKYCFRLTTLVETSLVLMKLLKPGNFIRALHTNSLETWFILHIDYIEV